MDALPEKLVNLLAGNIPIAIGYQPDNVILAEGSVFVRSNPETIWAMLTDYNNLHHTLPKVVSSRLVEEDTVTKVIEQTGKSGIFIFEKIVNMTLKVDEEYPKRLHFRQIGGDFRVYEGEWRFETVDCGLEKGTVLTYEASIKPSFFAPPFLVSFVQSQDLPTILKAIRSFCESDKRL